MAELFELVTSRDTDRGEVSVRLGIRLAMAGNEIVCPVLGPWNSHEALEKGILILQKHLEAIQQKGRTLFSTRSGTGIDIRPDMGASEIWDVLATVADEADWVATFNELEAEQRHAVAEHVLTRCNIFSGKAAQFSKRYDSDTGRMA